MRAKGQVEEGAQQVGMLALHEQAPRVVAQIVLPALILVVGAEHQVVVARLKKQPVLRVAPLDGLLRLSRNIPWSNRPWSNQAPIGPPATRLETPDDAAQPACQRLADEKDSMQVVGHHLNPKDLDFGMVSGDVPPLILYRAPQFGQLQTRIGGAATNTAQQRAPTFDSHRDHIDAATRVVMTYKTAFHRRFLLSRK